MGSVLARPNIYILDQPLISVEYNRYRTIYQTRLVAYYLPIDNLILPENGPNREKGGST